MQLRPFQDELVEAARVHIRARQRRILLQLATGGGKTVIAAFIINGVVSRALRVWFVVHRKELIKQTSRTFAEVGIAHSFIAAGFPYDPGRLVMLASVATLAARLEELNEEPDVIVWDEAHHSVAATWLRVHERFPNALHIGLSATPVDLGGRGLDKSFDVMVKGPSTGALIGMGFLSPFQYFGPGTPTLAGVQKAEQAMGDAMQQPKLIGDFVEHYLENAPGEQGIFFAVNREHSRRIADAFNAEGIKAAHIDGSMSSGERDRFDDAFRAGDIRIGCNVELFGEGYDVPGIGYLGMGRRTDSLRLFLQQAGRVLRIFPGKTRAVINDHAGNWTVHGMPDDEREWSLKGVDRKSKGPSDAEPIRQCPTCFRITGSSVKVCPGCGYTHGTVWTPPAWQEGALFEIKGGGKAAADEAKAQAKAKRKAEERACGTDVAAFIRLGVSRGYDNPKGWALNQVKMRGDYSARFRRRA